MDIILIGAGNVTTHLGLALSKDNNIIQIYSRNLSNAKVLAGKFDCDPVDDVKRVEVNADLYVISVPDDAISKIVKDLPIVTGIVVHTAGSVSMDVLDRFKDHGVLYPFQTFSKSKEVEFDDIPVLVEGNSEETTAMLFNLAASISKNVYRVDSYSRSLLHVAAVFACNFVNHFYGISGKILEKADLPFEILKPLIEETTSKVFELSPRLAQTGPAIRNDKSTMEKHLRILADNFKEDNFAGLYKDISERIIKSVNNK